MEMLALVLLLRCSDLLLGCELRLRMRLQLRMKLRLRVETRLQRHLRGAMRHVQLQLHSLCTSDPRTAALLHL